MTNILTNDQVKKALFLDDDADTQELEEYNMTASSFIYQKTGYDFGADAVKEPLAVLCAKLYIKQIYFGNSEYNKEHDYTLGIASLIVDLQLLAKEKASGESL